MLQIVKKLLNLNALTVLQHVNIFTSRQQHKLSGLRMYHKIRAFFLYEIFYVLVALFSKYIFQIHSHKSVTLDFPHRMGFFFIEQLESG